MRNFIWGSRPKAKGKIVFDNDEKDHNHLKEFLDTLQSVAEEQKFAFANFSNTNLLSCAKYKQNTERHLGVCNGHQVIAIEYSLN